MYIHIHPHVPRHTYTYNMYTYIHIVIHMHTQDYSAILIIIKENNPLNSDNIPHIHSHVNSNNLSDNND